MELISDSKKCSGCGACKLACSIDNYNEVAPSRALLEITGEFPDPGVYRIHLCDQCGICAETCPVEAIVLEDGIYQINEEECTECHACVDACPNDVMKIQPENDIPAKCILCGECARICPREAITISDDKTVKEC